MKALRVLNTEYLQDIITIPEYEYPQNIQGVR